MSDFSAPGVFIEEAASGARSITPVPTSTAGIVGVTLLAPDDGNPRLVTSFVEYERDFGGRVPVTIGGVETVNYVAHAARAFFDNGGRRLYVQAVGGAAPAPLTVDALKAGLAALAEVDEISVVMMPDMVRFDDASMVEAAAALIAHCERRGDRIALIDPPKGSSIADVGRFRANFDSSYAAIYYPWVVTADATPVVLPPSGFVAGIYARVDNARGVHKPPANEVISGITGFESPVSSSGQSLLNPEGINALRFFQGRGNRVWGARTLSKDPEWTYVNVRRFFVYLERSIDRSTQWAVFEPNNETLWAKIRKSIDDFLYTTWHDGALLGDKPEDAFFVRCDRTTMTQNDLDNGRLVCLVGVAPVRPAEFVIFRIGQLTADAAAASG